MAGIQFLIAFFCITAVVSRQQENSVSNEIDFQRTVVLRLEPQPKRPTFMHTVQPPRAISQQQQHLPTPNQEQQSTQQSELSQAEAQAQAQLQALAQSQVFAQQQQTYQQLQQEVSQNIPAKAVPPPIGAQQPVLPASANTQQQTFAPHDLVTPPPPPPVNIPPDVQNQLIKFFGLDSFGIPGLTGNHPNGFAGAMQELRAAGIPVQGLPAEHVGGQPIHAPQSDVLVQANPNFANELNTLMNEAHSGNTFHSGGGNVPLPDAKPGENGLIGLLSSSIRKLVKDSGVAEALSQGIPSVLGTGGAKSAGGHSTSFQTDSDAALSESGRSLENSNGVRRQQSTAERALSGFASALGGGGGNSPTHAGLPRIPGIPLLPGGIPRNAQGQIDVVSLIGSITRRVSNGTTLADVLPPEQLQTLADNVTDALLPATPENFELSKFMGRWFEGINSPRASEQRCVVHHYGGLTMNDKTATFTALKIYREGSEFGPVRYSIGYAFRGGNKDAMLQLHSSENSDVQPFWVYKLGPEGTDPFGNKQYEYAIVSNWVKYPITILVRDPDTYKKLYDSEVLRWLEDQGFINGFVRAFNLLQPVSYNSCQYADNTFELFGKK